MAIRKILTISNPLLYEISLEIKEFNKELRELIINMFDTMYNSNGVGLAAVQIGVLKRILVIDLEFMGFSKEIFINPKLIFQSKETQYGDEGCLSVPDLYAPLVRPKSIEVEYYNITGQKKIIKAEDIMARALLHEMDHLDGKIYVDQLEDNVKKSIQKELNRIKSGKKVKNPQIPEYRKRNKKI